jgi:hypothetical protein
MFNILSHKGNANPNHTEIPSHQSGRQSSRAQQMLRGCGGEPLYTVAGDLNLVQPL